MNHLGNCDSTTGARHPVHDATVGSCVPPKPPGRPPHDKMGKPKKWDYISGCWVDDKHSVHNDDNQFQLNLMNLIPSQKGVEYGLSTSQCTGESKPHYPFKGKILGTYDTSTKLYDGKSVEYVKVINCFTDDGQKAEHQPHMFLDLRASVIKKIKWNPPPAEMMNAWKRELESEAHKNSMARAARIMQEYLDTWEASSEHIICILDGNGENRHAMKQVLVQRGIAKSNWPEIITFEKDAEVALANTIMFPEDKIIFTGADDTFTCKSQHHFSGHKYPLVEHLIVKKNKLYTQDMKARTKVFYFDPPGGPVGNQEPVKCKAIMKHVLEELYDPQLIIGITLSYRAHGGMEIPDLVPLDDFKGVEFFRHKKVRCGIYKRCKGVDNEDIGYETEVEKEKEKPLLPYWVRLALVLLHDHELSKELVAQQVQLSANLHSETIDATGLLVLLKLLKHPTETIIDRLITMQTELALGLNVDDSDEEPTCYASSSTSSTSSTPSFASKRMRTTNICPGCSAKKGRGCPPKEQWYCGEHNKKCKKCKKCKKH